MHYEHWTECQQDCRDVTFYYNEAAVDKGGCGLDGCLVIRACLIPGSQ